MITRETDYAVRALLSLAEFKDQMVSASDLAESSGIPYRFLRGIMLKLSKARLVYSSRGPNGGISMAYPLDELSLLDIVLALDPDSVTLNLCLKPGEYCQRDGFCIVHDKLKGVQDILHTELANIKISHLLAKQ
jgi:Rrf2 family protein